MCVCNIDIYIYIYKWKHSCGIACQIVSILSNFLMTKDHTLGIKSAWQQGKSHLNDQISHSKSEAEAIILSNCFPVVHLGVKTGSVMILWNFLRFWWKRPEEITFQGPAGWRHGCDGQQSTLSAVLVPALLQGGWWSGNLTWHGLSHVATQALSIPYVTVRQQPSNHWRYRRRWTKTVNYSIVWPVCGAVLRQHHRRMWATPAKSHLHW